LTNRKSLLCSK